jgi:hypothetical protein
MGKDKPRTKVGAIRKEKSSKKDESPIEARFRARHKKILNRRELGRTVSAAAIRIYGKPSNDSMIRPRDRLARLEIVADECAKRLLEVLTGEGE